MTGTASADASVHDQHTLLDEAVAAVLAPTARSAPSAAPRMALFEQAAHAGFSPINSSLTFGPPADLASGWDGTVWAIDGSGAPHVYDPLADTWQLHGTGIGGAALIEDTGPAVYFRGGEVFIADGRTSADAIAMVWPQLPASYRKFGVKGAGLGGWQTGPVPRWHVPDRALDGRLFGATRDTHPGGGTLTADLSRRAPGSLHDDGHSRAGRRRRANAEPDASGNSDAGRERLAHTAGQLHPHPHAPTPDVSGTPTPARTRDRDRDRDVRRQPEPHARGLADADHDYHAHARLRVGSHGARLCCQRADGHRRLAAGSQLAATASSTACTRKATTSCW